jgi:STE24 endopeptidase
VAEPIFTPEQLAEIQAYHWPHYVWGAVGDVVNLCIALLLMRFLVRPLYTRCARVPGGVWGPTLAFALSYYALTSLLYLPLDVWFDYVLEHRFGLSNDTPSSYALDYAKGHGLHALALSALAVGLFGLARRVRIWWALLGGVGAIVLLFSAALDPFRDAVYFTQTPLPAGELRDRITALMAKAQIEVGDVLVEGTSRSTVRIGAYFAGSGPTRRIVLNDSMLKQLTTDEMLAAVAHEAGHVHESRWPGALASAFTLIAFLFGVDRLLRLVSRKRWWGVEQPADIRSLPLVMTVFSLCAVIAAPISAAFSREREHQADVYALELTKNPDAFASMLVKAARVNKMDPDPPPWVTLKGRTHPSIRERLDAVEDWKQHGGG